jgi:hypothetical protein
MGKGAALAPMEKRKRAGFWLTPPIRNPVVDVLVADQFTVSDRNDRVMDQSTLSEVAREALRIGKLPNRRPDWIWGGPTPGVVCSVCGGPISAGETGLEAEFRDPLRPNAARIAHTFHVRCFATWEQERDAGGVLPRSTTDGTILNRELDGQHREEPA